LHVSFKQQNKEETDKVELSEELWYFEAKEYFEDQSKSEEGEKSNRSGDHEKVGAVQHQTQRIVTLSISEYALGR
jgi:hypothetical protein